MIRQLVTAAAAVAAATTFTVVVVVIVVMAVTATAAVMAVIVVMMIVCAVYVAVLQLFSRCFTNSDHFYAELQVLTCQHVVTVNDDVIVFNASDFNRNRALIGFCQETHTDLQFVNAHKDVLRNALYQVFIVLAVSVIRFDSNVKFVARLMTVKGIFQA